MLGKAAFAFLALLAAAAPGAAASSEFGMSYHVDRVDAAKLNPAQCVAAAERASNTMGYVTANRQVHPGQLAVLGSGPRGGGGSLTVYCITVDRKTAIVVQALDYNRPNSAVAQRVADRVRQGILGAAR